MRIAPARTAGGCVRWSSRISPTKPKNGGLCVQLYWGYAFYFYDLRKHYTSRMTSEFGINVLHTDTDVVWLANPYPALKRVFGRQQIIGMSDRPMINAGVFYAQNIAAGDGASWVLRELSRRIHTFLYARAPSGTTCRGRSRPIMPTWTSRPS